MKFEGSSTYSRKWLYRVGFALPLPAPVSPFFVSGTYDLRVFVRIDHVGGTFLSTCFGA